MKQVWEILVRGGRWLWKNSWWILPAGETLYNRLRSWLDRKKNDPEINTTKTDKDGRESGVPDPGTGETAGSGAG